jgi:hypothetical protein
MRRRGSGSFCWHDVGWLALNVAGYEIQAILPAKNVLRIPQATSFNNASP